VTQRDLDAPEILVAQARALPQLSERQTADLLAEVRERGRGPALDQLVEHQLATILELAAARRGKGVEVGDLAQEAAIASVVAVVEYATRGGLAPGLDAFVSKLMASHMDDMIELAALDRASAEAFIRDAQTYELAEVRMRHELGREATAIELAAQLGWPDERVAIVAGMLNEARSRYDSEIVEYLDDIDEE
jgi:DNA-directed RNA polymerase specialized sigma subunit